MAGNACGQDELSKSCAVIDYPGGQDGAVLPARDCPLPVSHYSQQIHKINPLLVQLALSKGWDIGLVVVVFVIVVVVVVVVGGVAFECIRPRKN